jgi:hypothetical protein
LGIEALRDAIDCGAGAPQNCRPEVSAMTDDPKLHELAKLLAEGGPEDFKRLAEWLGQDGDPSGDYKCDSRSRETANETISIGFSEKLDERLRRVDDRRQCTVPLPVVTLKSSCRDRFAKLAPVPTP